jgi:hypothetical protein
MASAGVLDVLTPLMARPYTRSDPYRGVAQLVARGVWDAEAGGSSPLTPTVSRFLTPLATHLPARLIRP